MAKLIQKIPAKAGATDITYVAVCPPIGPITKSMNPFPHLFYEALAPYGVRLIDKTEFTINYFAQNRDKIDAVHIHWLFDFVRKGSLCSELKALAGFVKTLLFLRKSGIKIIHTVHNFPPFHEDNTAIDYLFSILLINLADLVICHSQSARRQLLRFTLRRDKLRVMPHGSYSGFYRNDIGKDAARSYLGIPDTTFVYLFFGLIREYKGIEELIEVFLSLKGDGSLLYIVGDSIHNGYVKDRIIPRIAKSPNIRLVNSYIAGDDVQLYFNACDAVVYPFRRITSSGSAMLAYTFAKPVVIRDCGLARELFDENTAVFFSGKEDFAGAFEKVRRLDPIKARDILRKKDKEFSWGEVVKRIERVYTGTSRRKSHEKLIAATCLF